MSKSLSFLYSASKELSPSTTLVSPAPPTSTKLQQHAALHAPPRPCYHMCRRPTCRQTLCAACLLPVAPKSVLLVGCLEHTPGGITVITSIVKNAQPSIFPHCSNVPPFADPLSMYCFVCLEISASGHHCSNGCPLFCTDECDCVPCRFITP